MVKDMYIESIELNNYRNYRKVKVEFGKNTNILYGNNAQGKTNILESIYMAATTKSHRGTKDRDIIRIGEDESHIRLFLRKRDVSHKIDMHLRKSKNKGVAIDGIAIRRATELYGLLNVIFFSPEDLSIIKNGPAERRRFMDLELCQISRLYYQNLAINTPPHFVVLSLLLFWYYNIYILKANCSMPSSLRHSFWKFYALLPEHV